jgi:hypothetical protein
MSTVCLTDACHCHLTACMITKLVPRYQHGAHCQIWSCYFQASSSVFVTDLLSMCLWSHLIASKNPEAYYEVLHKKDFYEVRLIWPNERSLIDLKPQQIVYERESGRAVGSVNDGGHIYWYPTPREARHQKFLSCGLFDDSWSLF